MTLEGTIVYADKQAEWMSKYSDVGDYESRAEYYRQLAEWLRELKAYRKAHEEIQHEPLVWEYGQAIEKCLWIIDSCLKEVNNADSD